MTRQTSVDAFNYLRDNKILSTRRWQVYSALFDHGPCTASELAVEIYKGSTRLVGEAKNVCARLNELSKMGIAQELGTRVCNVSGMTVILWDVTDKLPIKLDKPKRIKCKSCDGKGYHETTQTKLF